jgi:hypothetical protein
MLRSAIIIWQSRAFSGLDPRWLKQRQPWLEPKGSSLDAVDGFHHRHRDAPICCYVAHVKNGDSWLRIA